MIETKIVTFNDQYSPIITQIRTKVFVEEQGVSARIDFDGRDETATHIIVTYHNKAIGTARILDDGHIGRVAVLKEYRDKGAGHTAVLALVAEAKKMKINRAYLNSQIHASRFYEKMGFNICGKEFVAEGIKHIEMELYLHK